jgi:hypothetical protein
MVEPERRRRRPAVYVPATTLNLSANREKGLAHSAENAKSGAIEKYPATTACGRARRRAPMTVTLHYRHRAKRANWEQDLAMAKAITSDHTRMISTRFLVFPARR